MISRTSRWAFLLSDVLGIVLFACLLYWAAQHLVLTPPSPIPPSSLTTIEQPQLPPFLPFPSQQPPKLRPKPPVYVSKLINSIYEQNKVTRSYDPTYIKLAYPGGDVDVSTGVCTDVVIRAFRAQGIDLQRSIHEDMRKAFKDYPKIWGMRTPDPNIDHRRVPNLMKFFERKGKSLAPTDNPDQYQSGDLVVWQLPSGQQHIGVVMAERSSDELRPLIGHNVGQGTNIEDVLFAWPIVGHYRYFGSSLADNHSQAK